MIWKATIITSTFQTYADILIAPEISYSDVMDGTADTMTFSFKYDYDIVKNIKLKDTCEVRAYTNDNELIKTYYMCISQISSEKMSTTANTGYMVTISLKEQTILLKDCIRTDTAITPSLYPQLETKNSDGTVTQYNIYQTLYDALLKIIDCNNAVIFNTQITNIDEDLVNALLDVACPNLTYRDLSTYSQLYDICMRVGRIPYLENGKLYGIKLTGRDTEQVKDISLYSHLSTLKQTGINDNVYSIKSYNNIYDDEFVVVPQIFTDMVFGKEANKSDLELLRNCASTEDTEGVTQTHEEAEVRIDEFIKNYYATWTNLNGNRFQDTSKGLLFVNGFNNESAGIEDARSYFIELPYNIELIDSIYACYPYAVPSIKDSGNNTYFYSVSCGFRLNKLESKDIIENTMYESLSSLQKRTKAYYVRGTNKINNVVCLLDVSDSDLTGDFAWSSTQLYNKLRSVFYVVKLKPILNTTYTNYSSILDRAINNLSLPYSQVSDKQVYPILDYNVKKGAGDVSSVNVISTDYTLLNISAGDYVYYQGEKYLLTNLSIIVNNETIEATFEITKNIVTNSLLSSYKDNIRISSLLNAESSVDRSVHLFADHFLSLSESPTPDLTGNMFFDFGSALRLNSIYNNGFSEGELTYPEISTSASISIINRWNELLSNYPLALNPIIPYENDLEISNNEIVICTPTYLQSVYFPGQTGKPTLTINPDTDLPIRLYVGTVADKDQDRDVFLPETGVLCDTVLDLKLAIPTFQYIALTSLLFGDPSDGNIFSYTFMGILKNADRYPQDYKGSDIISMRGNYGEYKEWPSVNWVFGGTVPSIEEIISNKSFKMPTFTYLVYDSSSFNTTKTLGIERLVSSSGLLTKVEYCLPSPYYSISATYGDKIIGNTYANSITIPSNYSGGDLEVKVNSYVPILYNTSTNGCRIVGIGTNVGEQGYSFTFLPNQFGKGQYLDLRENIRPYIQFKTQPYTLDLGDPMYIRDINPEFKWLDINRTYARKEYDGAKIFKVNKYLPCNLFNDYSTDNLITECSIVKNTDASHLTNKFTLASPIEKNEDFEYILCLYRGSGDNIEYTNLIKFDVVKTSPVSTICINSHFQINYKLN